LSILSIARSLVRVLNSTDRMAGESRDGRESATRAHEARQDRWIWDFERWRTCVCNV